MATSEKVESQEKDRRNRENPGQFEANKTGLPVVFPDIVVMRRQVVSYVYVPGQAHPDVHKWFCDALDQAMAMGDGNCVIGRFASESTVKYLCIGDISKEEKAENG